MTTRLNISVPDELAAQARKADLRISRICQEALQAALDARTPAPKKVVRAPRQEPARGVVRRERDYAAGCTRVCPEQEGESVCAYYEMCVVRHPEVLPRSYRRRAT